MADHARSRKRILHELFAGAAGVASIITILGILLHYSGIQEQFRFSGWMHVWEIAWGWFTLFLVISAIAVVIQYLSRKTRIPPVVNDK